jgi:hypothetical protein
MGSHKVHQKTRKHRQRWVAAWLTLAEDNVGQQLTQLRAAVGERDE